MRVALQAGLRSQVMCVCGTGDSMLALGSDGPICSPGTGSAVSLHLGALEVVLCGGTPPQTSCQPNICFLSSCLAQLSTTSRGRGLSCPSYSTLKSLKSPPPQHFLFSPWLVFLHSTYHHQITYIPLVFSSHSSLNFMRERCPF